MKVSIGFDFSDFWSPLPDVTQTDSVAETREQEVQLPSPVSSLRVLILLELELVPRLALPLQQK